MKSFIKLQEKVIIFCNESYKIFPFIIFRSKGDNDNICILKCALMSTVISAYL